ncbi:MAG: ABC transporter ATP-binding protein [Mycoplasmatales bacterium]
MKYLKKYKFLSCISLLLVLIQVATMLYQPTLISNVIIALNGVDAFGNAVVDMTEITKNGMLVIIVGIVGLIAGLINTFAAANISQKVGANIRHDSFINIQKLSFQDIEKFSTSHLIVRLTNDVTQVQNLLMLLFQILLRIPFLFVGAFIMAVIAIPQLWWTIVLFIVLVIIILAISLNRMIPKFSAIQKENDAINSIVKENMDGVRVVKSFVTEDKEEERFDARVDVLTENFIATGNTFALMIPAFTLVANVIMAAAIYFVGGWAIDDPALIGELVSFTTYIMQIMFAIIMGGFIMMQASRALVSVKRINEVLDANSSINYGDDEIQKIKSIEFKNVSFKYDDGEENTLNNISFSILEGEKVGIVGSTGSGKTTLVQLLPRLYDVTDGEILINGKNIKVYKKDSLINSMSIVLQKAILFSGTIKDNIMQANVAAKDLDLELATKRAQAYEFIVKKEKQFEDEVYQKGANLSGGQKQRLSISRGLIKNPSLLILDDSTSALDARSENLVKEAINNDLKDVTTIIVAQKISSVVDMDKIVVLNEGSVCAIGTHKELIKISSVYQEIYETQKGKGVEK